MFIPIGSDSPLERVPWATVSIIAITVLSQYLDLGTGGWLIPISLFQHGSFSHLLSNMLFLWVFGSYLEVRIGWLGFVCSYIMCELGAQVLFSVVLGGSFIGASGAISGIMALYLVRFYHSKMKTIFWLGPFPVRFKLPVMFLIPFWFTKDILFGLMGMIQVTNVAYFAHIGGFLTGFIIAKAMKYDVEGKSEHFKLKAARRLVNQKEMSRVLPDLKRALAEDQDDPEVHHLLALYYARSDSNAQMAKKYYCQAMDKYMVPGSAPLKAASTFIEMTEKCGPDKSLENYLKYAAIFEEAEDHDSALTVLSKILDRDDLSGEAGKRGLARLIVIARAAGEPAMEAQARELFVRIFPGVGIPEPALAQAGSALVLPSSRDQLGGSDWSPFRWLSEITDTWVFWFWWTVIFLPTVIFVQNYMAPNIRDGSVLLALIVPTILAAAATHFYKHSGDLAGSFIFGMGHRKSERRALRDFNIRTYLRKGIEAEKSGRYMDAATYYKGVLEEDPEHIEARLRLADLYHHRLIRKGSAIYEYDKLISLLSKTAPQYRTVVQAREELVNGVKG